MSEPTHSISLVVNGQHVSADVEARYLLVDFLRHRLRLTGTHVGCAHGACGACTILLNGVTARSCLTFAVQADGAEIATVESLAEGDLLSPLQEEFQRHHALQCGYCTPGMLMSITALLTDIPNPTDQDIREYLAGNLCRCTGYGAIMQAVKAAARRGARGSSGTLKESR